MLEYGPPFAAAIFVADIGGWHDGDVGLGGVSQVAGSSNGNGQESGDHKLHKINILLHLIVFVWYLNFLIEWTMMEVWI